MERNPAFILPLFLMACWLCVCSCRPEKPIGLSSQERQELDSLVLQISESLPVPGIAVAVVKGNSVYYRSAGKVQLPEGSPLTDSTLFFMGNLSEPMIATAILRLTQAGRIRLDDPVVKHLPYFRLGDANYRSITIRHLLTHTSGVPYHSAVWDMPYNAADALEMTTRSIYLQESLFKPGSRIKRNPYNYDILADLIEKVDNVPLEAHMQTHVFNPLNMRAATYSGEEVMGSNPAQPHYIADWLTYVAERDTLYPYNREHAGSIGLHASVQDMSTWIYMLLNDGKTEQGTTFFNRKLARESVSRQFNTQGGGGIGMGWDIKQHGGTHVFSKGHQLGGFSADIRLMPVEKTGVLVLGNLAGDFDAGLIGDKIVHWLSGGGPLRINPPIHIPMGKTLARTGSLDSAFSTYHDLLEEAPDTYNFSEEALSQLGVNLFYRLDRKSDALRVYRFCADKNPNSAYSQLNLAEAYILQGDTLRAREAFARSLKFPGDKSGLLPRLDYLSEMLKE